jgi:hypothetical protein
MLAINILMIIGLFKIHTYSEAMVVTTWPAGSRRLLLSYPAALGQIIIIYYYSSLYVTYVQNRFAAPKKCYGFHFLALF